MMRDLFYTVVIALLGGIIGYFWAMLRMIAEAKAEHRHVIRALQKIRAELVEASTTSDQSAKAPTASKEKNHGHG